MPINRNVQVSEGLLRRVTPAYRSPAARASGDGTQAGNRRCYEKLPLVS